MGVHSVQITTNATTAVPLFVHGAGVEGDGTFKEVRGNVSDAFPTIIQNTDGTNTVYLGDSGVTAANGFPLIKGASLPITWVGSDAAGLWAIAGGGTPVVAILAGRQ